MTKVTTFEDLPRACRMKKLKLLQDATKLGAPISSFNQEERDLLHMETTEENLEYWKDENERAESDERCIHCQSIARSIIVALRAREAPVDDTRESILSYIMTEADLLPATE